MVNYKFVYFDGRGLGEAIRLIFHYAQQEFVDERLDFETFLTYKPSPSQIEVYLETKYGHVPVLELSDGRKLYEAHAIAQYLAKKFGLAGNDEWEEAKVNEIASFHKEVGNDMTGFIRTFVPIYKFEEADKEIYKKKALDVIDEKFPIYVKILKESGSGFLLQNGITWVDFFVSETITTLRNLIPETMSKYPELIEYQQRIHTHPKLKNYIESRPERTI